MAHTNEKPPIPGDDFLQQFAKWMRGKERRIASSSPQAVLRSKTPESWLASLSLSNSSAEKNPLLLKLTLNHLDYLLVRFEEVGIEQQATGPLDLALDFQPTRPFSAVFVDHDTYTQERKSSFATETMSFFSWMSSTSTNAIGTKTQASLAQDARYCFSCFTKIPSLELSPKSIHFGFVLGFETLPDSTYVPLDAFKNLQMLRLIDVDARVLFGWDRLSTSLKVLEITGNGVDDIQSLLLDRIDADARARQKAFASSYEASSPTESTCRSLSSKWTELRRLNLSSNAITYAPGSECWIHFPTLVHLDLSNNLLVQVPSGLTTLVSLRSLNLSNNMIESLSHLPTSLGAIQSLDLSRNRIQSLAGLERLKALQSIDISRNHIDDATELYRLTGLPHLSLLVVGTGNTLEKSHSKFSWRVETYLAFARENNSSISVDGIGPSWSESRTISAELARIPPRKTYSHSISPDQVSVRPPSEPREPVASTSTPQAPHDNERDSVHVASPVKPSTKPKPKKKRKPVGRVVQIDDSMQQRQLGTETAESEPNFEQDEEAHGTSHEGHATTRAHQRSASEQAYRAPQHQHQRHRTIGQSSSDETVAPAGTHTTPNEATDGFRRRIEMLRAEGGEDWLRYVEARSK